MRDLTADEVERVDRMMYRLGQQPPLYRVRAEVEPLVREVGDLRAEITDHAKWAAEYGKTPDGQAHLDWAHKVNDLEKQNTDLRARCEKAEAALARLRGAATTLGEYGCMDGYCDFRGRAEGQHTNAGCQCLSSVHNPQLRGALRRLLSEARALAEEGK